MLPAPAAPCGRAGTGRTRAPTRRSAGFGVAVRRPAAAAIMALVATATAPQSTRRRTRPAEPAEPGLGRHHRLAGQRAHVLRGAVRDLLHAPVGRSPSCGRPSPSCSTSRSPPQHDVLVLSLGHLPDGRASRRARAGRPHRALFQVGSWGLREWFISPSSWARSSSPARSTSTPSWSNEGLTISSSDPYGSVVLPGDRLPRPARHRRAVRLPARARPHVHGPRFTHEQATSAIVVSYYWHFVDVVWIALFADDLPDPVTTGADRVNPPMTRATSAPATATRCAVAASCCSALARLRCSPTPRSPPRAAPRPPRLRRRRRSRRATKLFAVGCASCHGLDGEGRSATTAPCSARPDRRRRGRGRLPGRHRPDADGGPRRRRHRRRSVRLHRRADRRSSPHTSASLGPGPAIPPTRTTSTSRTPTCPRAASCSAPTAPRATTSPARAAR